MALWLSDLTPTVNKTANYTANPFDFVLVDTTSGTITVTFPTAPPDGTRIGVKQVVRGGINTVALALGGSDVFNVSGGSNTGSLMLLNQAGLWQYVASGAIWVTISTDVPLSQLDARYADDDALAVGEQVFARSLMVTGSSIPALSGSFKLSFFTARKTETTTQVRVLSGATAAGATPTLCRLGLYLVDGSDNGTLVASIANDTTLWASATSSYTRSWSSSYAKVAGQRYALGQLIVTSNALPSWPGYALMASAQSEANQVPRLNGAIASQTDLPSSFTVGSIAGSLNRHYGAILP